jgi:hypothetical protein
LFFPLLSSLSCLVAKPVWLQASLHSWLSLPWGTHLEALLPLQLGRLGRENLIVPGIHQSLWGPSGQADDAEGWAALSGLSAAAALPVDRAESREEGGLCGRNHSLLQHFKMYQLFPAPQNPSFSLCFT